MVSTLQLLKIPSSRNLPGPISYRATKFVQLQADPELVLTATLLRPPYKAPQILATHLRPSVLPAPAPCQALSKRLPWFNARPFSNTTPNLVQVSHQARQASSRKVQDPCTCAYMHLVQQIECAASQPSVGPAKLSRKERERERITSQRQRCFKSWPAR